MPKQNIILNDEFWKFLVSVEELKEKKDKKLFCALLGVNEVRLGEFQQFLNNFEVLFESDDSYIYPLKEKYKIKMEFSFSEWLALQASLEIDKKDFVYYFQRIIQNKIMVVQTALKQFNLYKKPVETKVHLDLFENLKKKIDYNICHKKTVKIHFYNKKETLIFAHRLVFLDGILCIIGECTIDKSLAYFGLEDISELVECDIQHEVNFSQIEINEFICHLRLVNGKEERLVLKVYGQNEADLFPSYHFLGNPFVTTNAEGDMIWAATIEMCDDIFSWLCSIKERAEVLDPGHIRKEFAHYCELKKENSGLKKAS